MIYRFEGYQLDDGLFELRAGDEILSLPRKSFDLLHYLLQHSDRIVSKEELFDEIWPSQRVTETVLPVNIRTIRKALGGDRAETILKNVRGRGYCIACPVEKVAGTAAPEPALRLRSGFVGRTAVIARLQDDLQAATEGQGRVVLIGGDPGIGKTRLLDEIAQWSPAPQALVLYARCSQDSGAPPFWPVLQLLRSAQRTLRSPELAERVAQSELDLDRARAGVLDLLGDDLFQRVDPGAARFRLVQTVMRLVEQVSQILPLVLLVDDLQCADDGTLRVFEMLTRELSDKPVMAAAAYRDTDLRRGSAVARMLGGISGVPCVRQVKLRGLKPGEVAQFVSNETGQEPSQALVDALSAHTEGNPFFLRETLRLLESEGAVGTGRDVAISELGLPQGIRDAIGRRLATLSKDCFTVLRWASVIGRRFSFPILEQVCPYAARRTLELLGEAEDARIIGSSSGNGGPLALGQFAFSQGLIRDTIYEEITGPERVLLHRAVGEAFEKLYGARSSEHVFELARHFFEAAPGGDISRAVDYSVRAARRAFQSYAYEEAVHHLDRARLSEDLRVPRDDLRHCSLSMRRARALWRAERYGEAQAEYVRCAELARSLGHASLLGQCAVGLVGWPRFNRLSLSADEPGIELARVRALAEEALEMLGDEDSALRARLLGILARSEGVSPERRSEHAESALRIARASGVARATFDALMSKVALRVGDPAGVKEALALTNEAEDVARRGDAWPLLFAAYESRVPLLLTLGEMDAADRDIEAAGRIAADIGSPAYAYSVARFELARAECRGDRPGALELLERVGELGRQTGDKGARRCLLRLQLWMNCCSRTKREEVRRLMMQERAADPEQGANRASGSAYFRMLAGDRVGCARSFEHLARLGFDQIRADANTLWHYAGLADVSAWLEDVPRAEQIYHWLRPYQDLNVVSDLYFYRGSAATPLARLANLLGFRDEARSLFEQALEFNRRIGAPVAVVWTKFVYASMLRRGRAADRKRAEMLLAEVVQEGGSLHMGGLLRGIGA